VKWFEPIIAVVAVLLVVIPIIVVIYQKKKGTYTCECGHPQGECSGSCGDCKSKDKKITLTYVIGVDGMKCGMCESHINDIIRKNFDILYVKSSRKKKNTIIQSNSLLNVKKIREAITKEGYDVTSITFE